MEKNIVICKRPSHFSPISWIIISRFMSISNFAIQINSKINFSPGFKISRKSPSRVKQNRYKFSRGKMLVICEKFSHFPRYDICSKVLKLWRDREPFSIKFVLLKQKTSTSKKGNFFFQSVQQEGWIVTPCKPPGYATVISSDS